VGNGHHEGQVKEVARGRISLGIGGSSAKTDRGNQLAATQSDWSVFNQGMAMGTAGQAQGQQTLSTALSSLGPAEDYYKNLLTAGRTQTAANAAPAINAVNAEADATRAAEGTFGTARSGGTVAANRSAISDTQSKIDEIINTNLVQGKQAGAKGLQEVAGEQAGIGNVELSNAMSALGLGSNAVNDILSNATGSRAESNQINQQTQGQYGQALGLLLLAGGL
jgi:hypothetical protein